jgi:hypothetical protein
MKWLEIARLPDPPWCDLDLAGRIAEIMPKAIPEKGPGMWVDDLTEGEVRRILSSLSVDD